MGYDVRRSPSRGSTALLRWDRRASRWSRTGLATSGSSLASPGKPASASVPSRVARPLGRRRSPGHPAAGRTREPPTQDFERPMKVLITGSSGLIGIGGGPLLRSAPSLASTESTTTCGPTSSARAATRPGTSARPPGDLLAVSSTACLDIRDRESMDRAFADIRPRPDHPLRRPALARLGQVPTVRRLRRQRHGYAQPAGGDPQARPRRGVHPDEHQQGLRRRARTSCRWSSRRRGTTTPARGLRGHR